MEEGLRVLGSMDSEKGQIPSDDDGRTVHVTKAVGFGGGGGPTVKTERFFELARVECRQPYGLELPKY